MGGSGEFVECVGVGVVAEGGSGAVVQLVGDGVEVALVAGHFPALVPGQCAHRPVGKTLDAAGERVTDLVGFSCSSELSVGDRVLVGGCG